MDAEFFAFFVTLLLFFNSVFFGVRSDGDWGHIWVSLLNDISESTDAKQKKAAHSRHSCTLSFELLNSHECYTLFFAFVIMEHMNYLMFNTIAVHMSW